MDKLSKKGKRLYDYLKEKVLIEDQSTVNIGDICRDCHTTVFTLFRKTYAELREKGYLDENGRLLLV